MKSINLGDINTGMKQIYVTIHWNNKTDWRSNGIWMLSAISIFLINKTDDQPFSYNVSEVIHN